MDLEFLWDLIFPLRCVSCRKYPEGREPLCADCRGKIPVQQTFFCSVCSARLPEGRKICHQDSQFILGAAADYSNESVMELIYALKFGGVKAAAVPLGNLIVSYLKPLLQTEVQIVPVPLGKRRENFRSYNQAELIARIVALEFSAPLIPALLRIRETKPQSGLRDIKLREENVSGCFVAARGADLKGRTVLLIDDVTTTQTTFREAARALKQGGAKKVYAVAAAKA
jgi:competence protein ComFC